MCGLLYGHVGLYHILTEANVVKSVSGNMHYYFRLEWLKPTVTVFVLR